MKTRIFLFIALLLLSCQIAGSKEAEPQNNPSRESTINVVTSPKLYTLTEKWVNEYCNINSGIKINVIQSSDQDIAGNLNSGAEIGFISEESYSVLNNQALLNMVVAHDVIVPVMNASNPFLEDIFTNGIALDGFLTVFKNPGKNWGTLLKNGQNIPDLPVHVYILNDEDVISKVSDFLKFQQPSVTGLKVPGANELISAIQKDRAALGFCKLIDIIDVKNNSLPENVKLIPIDKNGNGKMDYMEDIYENLQTFSRGVWIGKYPDALSDNIYAVSSVKPEGAGAAFLKWVLTDGQQYLALNGFNKLIISERQSQLDKITNYEVHPIGSAETNNSIIRVILIFLTVFIIGGFSIDWVARHIRSLKRLAPEITSEYPLTFDIESLVVPNGLYFDRSHTWVFMRKDGSVKVGIDDFLQHVTGAITRIEMKKSGDIVKKGERLLSIIQNGKQLDIYAPVSGTIIAQNKTLKSSSSLLNTEPYANGWVYMIEPANWLRDIQFLSMAEKYKTWLREEFSRLKDFFVTKLNVNSPEYAHVVLQDGGALKDNLLAEMGPEVWEDFQTQFIDRVR